MQIVRPNRRVFVALSAVLLLVGAAALARYQVAAEAISDPAARAGAAPSTGAPGFDVAAVIDRVRYGFHPEPDGGWRAAHPTYEAAAREGALAFSPRQSTPTATAPDAGRADVPARGGAAERRGAVTFGSSTLRRGDAVIGGAPEVRRGRGGELELARGDVREALRGGGEGVEQTWSFARRPEGRGDLEVRVPVPGAHYLGATAAGLHFSSGALAVRYGHGTWIDAHGARTPVEARWDGAQIVLRVPETVLEASGYPAALDPLISAELDVDAPIYTPTTASAPSVASNGTNHLVAWKGECTPGAGTVGPSCPVYGVVVDHDGSLVTPGAFVIMRNGGYPIAVASNGDGYLVASSNGAVRVSATGVVLDTVPIALPVLYAYTYARAVAWNGTCYLVVWESYPRPGTFHYDIVAARLTPDGRVLDPDGILVAGGGGNHEPTVAASGSDFLVAWRHGAGSNFGEPGTNDVLAARVSGAGALLDATPIPIAAGPRDQQMPAVGWNGSAFVVAWLDGKDEVPAVRLTRVTPDGAIQDPGGRAVAGNALPSPSIPCRGAECLLVLDGSQIRGGVRIGPDGAPLDAVPIPLTDSGPAAPPSVVWNGSSYFVSWVTSQVLEGWRVDGTGAPLQPSPVPLSVAPNAQSNPALAWSGTEYLVVWQDYRTTSAKGIFGARVSAEGVTLDPDAILITSVAAGLPAVAWNGSHFLVAWDDRREDAPGPGYPYPPTPGHRIYGARVSSAGAVLDLDAIPISTVTSWDDPRGPAVASNGTDFLVAWAETRSSTYPDIYGARVSDAGVVLDPAGIEISRASWQQLTPDIASDGTDYLVVWQDYRTDRDVFGARVSAAGQVLDPTGFPIATAPYEQAVPAIAWGGDAYLVSWLDHRGAAAVGSRGSFAPWDVYAARVSRQGTVLDADGILLATGAMSSQQGARTTVAWDGQAFFVGWTDDRAGVPASSDLGSNCVVRAARVGTGGTASPVNGYPVSPCLLAARGPAAASSGPRRVMLAYTAAFPAPVRLGNGRGVSRVRARILDLTNQPPIAPELAVSTARETPVTITLAATDADLDALSYRIVAQPGHGVLTGTAPALTYTPAAGFTGVDTFTFAASDGTVESAAANVTVTVVAAATPDPTPTPTPMPESGSGSGCGCQQGNGGDVLPLGVALLALLALRRRRFRAT